MGDKPYQNVLLSTKNGLKIASFVWLLIITNKSDAIHG